MKTESSGYITNYQKRTDKTWRDNDTKRLVQNLNNSNKKFIDLIPKLEEIGFSDFICCELEPLGSELKNLDILNGIDWLAILDEELVALSVRVSTFRGFTVRKSSRGTKESEYKKLKEFSSNQNPVVSHDSFLVGCVETTEEGNPIKIHFINAKVLIDFITKYETNKKVIYSLQNGTDGNQFLFVSYKTLQKFKIDFVSFNLI